MVEKWREELEIKMRSEAIRGIIKLLKLCIDLMAGSPPRGALKV
jgi:hypothetical protein